MTRLLVVGGNGFVGKAVCRAAVSLGWDVTSASRSGPPKALNGPLTKVDWQRCSALDVEGLKRLADDKDYVVNCVGTLFESGPNRTYELMNYQPMPNILQAISRSSAIQSVAYVSAAKFDPMTASILHKYYETKGKAEGELQKWAAGNEEHRCVIMRPGFLYGWDRPATVLAAVFFRLLTFFTAGIFPKPIHVDHLAHRIIESLQSKKHIEVIESKDI